MSTLREAAQQALAHVQEFKRRWMAVPPFGNKVNKATREAVTLAHVPVLQIEEDLRAALAQQQEPVEIKPPNPEGATQCIVRWFAETPAGWVGAWDREALERFTAHTPRSETEQEPVAWMREGWGPDCGPYVEFYRNDEMGWRDRNGWIPLFTHTPRREWVSLTEEETAQVLGFGDYTARSTEVTLTVIARAIEAALKERNT
jgi:hypothetical protein